MTMKPGWYPAPDGETMLYFDGEHWAPPPAEAYPFGQLAEKRARNPLFFAFAGLSSIPAAFFLWAYFTEGQAIFGAVFLWSFMWAWIWWQLSDRYR